MTDQQVIDLGAKATLLSMKIAAPALGSILITGIVVSLFQAATQINEQTLAFVPKIMAMSAVLFLTGPWIIHSIVFFTQEIFAMIPQVTNP